MTGRPSTQRHRSTKQDGNAGSRGDQRHGTTCVATAQSPPRRDAIRIDSRCSRRTHGRPNDGIPHQQQQGTPTSASDSWPAQREPACASRSLEAGQCSCTSRYSMWRRSIACQQRPLPTGKTRREATVTTRQQKWVLASAFKLWGSEGVVQVDHGTQDPFNQWSRSANKTQSLSLDSPSTRSRRQKWIPGPVVIGSGSGGRDWTPCVASSLPRVTGCGCKLTTVRTGGLQ